MAETTYVPRDRSKPMEVVHGLLALTYRDAWHHLPWLEEFIGEPVGIAPYILYEDYEWKRIMSLQRGALTLHVCNSWYDRHPRKTRELEWWFRSRQIFLLDLPEEECRQT
jgi:hypothetical protein